MNFENTTVIDSEDVLIQNLLQKGSERRKAEDVLFSRYTYFIKEGIQKYSFTEDESFNAYSDTILQALHNIITGVFENRSSLKTYLFKIFTNKCVDLIRKKTTNKNSIHQTAEISQGMEMISDAAKTIIQQMTEKIDLQVLKTKMNQLADSCRQLLNMFAEGFSDKEIAVTMEYKSADVVKTSRLRCIDKLRQLYHTQY
jgi:RNA polymerase sigma factor (sigma-70 family)